MDLKLTKEEVLGLVKKQLEANFPAHDVSADDLSSYGDTTFKLTRKVEKNA